MEMPGACNRPSGSDNCDAGSNLTENQNSENGTVTIPCKYLNYASIDERRKSIIEHPGCIPVQNLAEAGFAYTGTGDSVSCFSCGWEYENRTNGDDPWDVHARYSPNCAFLRLVKGEQFIRSVNDGVQDSISHLQYATEENRLTTFTDWLENYPVKPEDLARAGFFFTGHEDMVRCFHCDGGLKNWKPGDNPMERHKSLFKTCPFILHLSRQSDSETGDDEKTPRGGPPTEEQMQELLKGDAAVSCLTIYGQEDEVRAGIHMHFKQTGHTDFDGEKLAGIIEELKEKKESCAWQKSPAN